MRRKESQQYVVPGVRRRPEFGDDEGVYGENKARPPSAGAAVVAGKGYSESPNTMQIFTAASMSTAADISSSKRPKSVH